MGSLLAVPLLAVGVAATMRTDLLGERTARPVLTQRITRGDLVITVTEDGNLESASNVDVKCEVAGGSTILWIIPDGTTVKKGDELIRLDSSAIEEQVNTQKIAFEKAKAAKIASEKDYSASKIAVQEYVEGTFKKDIQTNEAAITVAMENLRSAENTLQHTERMARKGYVTSLQKEAQAFAVERAKLDLQAAQTAKMVLEKFTRAKTLEDLESKRDTSEAKMRSDEAAFELESGKLKRLQLQLEKCIITAPQDGMVVYANDVGGGFRGGQPQVQVEEGAAVRERQSLIRLPDLSQMQAKVLVHESKVDRLHPGMRARIRIQDRELQGTVYTVANQPEPGGWPTPNVKKYATIVRIDGASNDLRPGMTAVVEILVAHLKNTLTVAEQSIVEQHGNANVWVKTAGAPERRPLKLGMSDGTYVEVKDGLNDAEEVLLNPRTHVAEAREENKEGEAIDVKKRFGSAKEGDGKAGGLRAPGATASAGREDGSGARGKSEGGGKGSRGSFNLMQFDKDGDKKISRDEAPPQMAGFFDNLDTNHDGFIDAAEAAAARKLMQQAGGGAPAKDRKAVPKDRLRHRAPEDPPPYEVLPPVDPPRTLLRVVVDDFHDNTMPAKLSLIPPSRLPY